MKIRLSWHTNIQLKAEDVQACDLLGNILPVIKVHASLVEPAIGARRVEHLIVNAITNLGLTARVSRVNDKERVIEGLEEDEVT